MPHAMLTADQCLDRALDLLVAEGVTPREGLWRDVTRWTRQTEKVCAVLPQMAVARYLRLLSDRLDEKLREG